MQEAEQAELKQSTGQTAWVHVQVTLKFVGLLNKANQVTTWKRQHIQPIVSKLTQTGLIQD